MKAWTVFCYDQADGAVLVFADTRNRARQIGLTEWPGDWDYVDVSANRAPAWDGLRNVEGGIITNDDIPTTWPRFFWDINGEAEWEAK